MAIFGPDILHELRGRQEVSICTEKHPDSAVTIWVVVADDEVLVRSVHGTKGVGTGTWRVAGRPRWTSMDELRRSRQFRRPMLVRSTAPVENFYRNTDQAPMRHRWCVQRYCRPPCDWNRGSRGSPGTHAGRSQLVPGGGGVRLLSVRHCPPSPPIFRTIDGNTEGNRLCTVP